MASIALRPELDVADDSEYSVGPTYLAHFSEHLLQARSHLAGKDGSAPLPPSFFPPQAYWTSQEKDLFFHGLMIHSRLRPDLIADEVKTKTVVDVCVYLALLERGARDAAVVSRKDLSIAMEVSDRWVAFEEQKACALIREEPKLETKELEKEREDEIRVRRNGLRAKRGQGKTASNERDREAEKQRRHAFNSWLKEREEEWKVENMLRALDLPTLRAMDRLLREGDEARLAEEPKAEEEQRASSIPLGELNSGQHRASGASSPINDEMIDPVLRAQSESAPPAAASITETIPSDRLPINPENSSQAAHMLPHAHFHPSTPPFPTKQLLPEVLPLVAPSTSTIQDKSLVDSNDTIIDGQLSPAARRRLQKRLHMRRKRAEARGVIVDETAAKLKPGRKKRRISASPSDNVVSILGRDENEEDAAVNAQTSPLHEALPTSEAQHPQKSVQVNMIDGRHESCRSNVVMLKADEQEQKRQSNPSGVTLPYRLLARLRATGLDADKLHEEGLGLLHLGGMVKLMRYVPTALSRP